MKLKEVAKLKVVSVLIAMQLMPAQSFAITLANQAIDPKTSVTPNVIFGQDNSGSMDSEVLVNASDGSVWWNASDTSITSNHNGYIGSGSGAVLASRPDGGTPTADWKKYIYLFPNGCDWGDNGIRHYCDNGDYFAIPPTAEFAWARSSDYNPLYYNPTITYTPWEPAIVGGSLKTFAAASPTAAKYEPLKGSGTLDLTAVKNSNATDEVFQMEAGMIAPAGTIILPTSTVAGSQYPDSSVVTSAPKTVPAGGWLLRPGDRWQMQIAYIPATYYVKQTCTVNGTTCVNAPDGATLKQVIATGTDLQNFANWFTYYRKRKLMLAATMGKTLPSLANLRAGLVNFNGHATPTMYNFDPNLGTSNNALKLVGEFYENSALGGTPTRQTMKFIGEEFKKVGVVQQECQRNVSFIITDGFPTNANVSPPAYDAGFSQASYHGNDAPYANTSGPKHFNPSLENIALYYYNNPLRDNSDFPFGKVATSSRDENPNLHVNTYALTLGAKGNYFSGNEALDNGIINDIVAGTKLWKDPDAASYTRDSIDDLWRATIVGRGKMYTAANSRDLTNQISAGLANILATETTQGRYTYTSEKFDTNTLLLASSATPAPALGGTLAGYKIDPTDGTANATAWQADTLLTARAFNTRYIATFDGTTATPFVASNSAITSQVNPGGTYAGAFNSSNDAELINYIRGDRTREQSAVNGVYRTRSDGILGTIVNAKPVPGNVVGTTATMIYQASNDGMLHAFDAATGQEKWAYIPGLALKDLGKYASPYYQHQMILDQAPTYKEISATQKMLVGGMGAGGKGYYALDVTNTNATSDADVAAKVKWEFPKATDTDAVKNMGYTMHPPLIVKRKSDNKWVALVTNGYNSSVGPTATGGDGIARVYVLDLMTGATLSEIKVGASTSYVGTPTAPGHLGALAAYEEIDTSNISNPKLTQYVYAGDEKGTLWRIDINSASSFPMMELKTGSTPQPVVAAPAIGAPARGRTNPLIAIGTGRLYSASDFIDPVTHTMYVVEEDFSTTTTLKRSNLVSKSYAGGNTEFKFDTNRGWYMDFAQSGEKSNHQPLIVANTVLFTTNLIDQTNPCKSGAYVYIVDTSSKNASPVWFPNSPTNTNPRHEFVTGGIADGLELNKTSKGKPAVSLRASGGAPSTDAPCFKNTYGKTNGMECIGPGATRGDPRRAAWREE